MALAVRSGAKKSTVQRRKFKQISSFELRFSYRTNGVAPSGGKTAWDCPEVKLARVGQPQVAR